MIKNSDVGFPTAPGPAGAAVEVKATRKVVARDVHGLQALAEEGVFRRLILVSEDRVEVSRAQIRCLPWRTIVEELWADRLLR